MVEYDYCVSLRRGTQVVRPGMICAGSSAGGPELCTSGTSFFGEAFLFLGSSLVSSVTSVQIAPGNLAYRLYLHKSAQSMLDTREYAI